MKMKFEVVYDLFTQPARSQYSAYSSRSDMENLKMVVEAGSSQQAERIVESMFGGRTNVKVKVAKILY
jgi:hypothetical protein